MVTERMVHDIPKDNGETVKSTKTFRLDSPNAYAIQCTYPKQITVQERRVISEYSCL